MMMFAAYITRLTLVALVVVLVGCGQNALVKPSAQTQAKTQTALSPQISISLTIPAGATTSGTSRKPLYLSVQTTSIAFTVTPDGAAALPTSLLNVSACATLVSGKSCQTTLPAVVGGVTLSVAAYDGVNGTGNLLSTGATHITVIGGQANQAVVTLSGVVRSITLGVDQPAPFAGTAATIKLFVTAIDAAGATITGAYTSPIVLTDSDGSGATTLSTTTLSNSSAAITLNYTGAVVNATINASAGSVSSSSITPATIISRAAGQYLYVSVASSSILTHQVEEFPLGATGNVAPSWVVTDPVGIAFPQAIAGDSMHRLYVFNNAYYSNGVDIAEYGPGVAGSHAQIIATLNDSNFTYPSGFAVDNSGGVYAISGSSNTGGNNISSGLSYYAPTKFSTSIPANVSPTFTYGQVSAQYYGDPLNVVIDSVGRPILAPQETFAYVTLPPASAQSSTALAALNVNFSYQQVQANGIGETAMATDASNNVYFPGLILGAPGNAYATHAVWVFPPLSNSTSTTNPAPSAGIYGSATHLDDGQIDGLAVSGDGRLFALVAISSSNPIAFEILVFPPGATGNTAPVQIISGASTGLVGSNNVKIAVF